MIANLKNAASVSGRNSSVNIEKALKGQKEQLTKLKARSTDLRTKLEKIDHLDFIIDVSQHPDEIEKQKDEFEAQYRAVGTRDPISTMITKRKAGGGDQFWGNCRRFAVGKRKVDPNENQIQGKEGNQL